MSAQGSRNLGILDPQQKIMSSVLIADVCDYVGILRIIARWVEGPNPCNIRVRKSIYFRVQVATVLRCWSIKVKAPFQSMRLKYGYDGVIGSGPARVGLQSQGYPDPAIARPD